MLIEVEGAIVPGPATNDAIIVSRPPFQAGGLALGALQFGVPAAPPLMMPGPLGAEIWLPTPATAVVIPSAMTAGRAYRLPLNPFPGGAGITVSAQFVGLLVAPVGGPAVPPAVCSSTWVTSPCIWFTY